jgi:hypothetical protein
VKELAGKIPCRPIEKAAVRGRVKGTLIYTPRRTLSPREAQAWTIHDSAVTLFYDRDFKAAAESFREVLSLLPGDTIAARLLERSEALMKNPPADDWTGVTMMSEK